MEGDRRILEGEEAIEIQTGRSRKLFLRKVAVGGKLYFDLRNYLTVDDLPRRYTNGDLIPTKKGIMLSVEVWKLALSVLESEIKKLS